MEWGFSDRLDEFSVETMLCAFLMELELKSLVIGVGLMEQKAQSASFLR